MLKVRCDRSELADSLADILSIVPTTQPMKPILVNCLLKARSDRLEVQVTDLDMGARVRLERVEIVEEGELALPANRFYSLIREIPDRHLVIDGLPDGRGAVVSSNGYELKILGQDPREFPEVPAFAADDALVVPREKFVEMLRRVAVAASRDASRQQLTGVFFEVEADKLTLTATDGKRLTNDYLRVDNPNGIERRAIVPNRVADVLIKVLAQGEAEFRLALGDPDLHASFGRGELAAKVIEGTYPEYRSALNLPAKVQVSFKKNELLTAARSAALMTDRNTVSVIFRFDEGKVSIATQSAEIGESKIEVPVSLRGSPIDVRFNPAYLIDALRTLNEEEVRMEFADHEKPAVVRGAQHYRHLVMPLVTVGS